MAARSFLAATTIVVVTSSGLGFRPLPAGAAQQESYRKARADILASGLKPAPIPRGGKFDQCDNKDICSRYPETVSCAGWGPNSGICRMAFIAPDGRIAVVAAFGEHANTLTFTGIAWANDTDTKHVKNILVGKPEFSD